MQNRYLQKVHLSSDVYSICLQHALSTEKQEVMGLLIGEIDEENGISDISSCLILRRSDKQPDRVEISPEQLMAATTHAEHLTQKLGRPMRVVGWYHSHPHITVWPSHVDIRTQAVYQTMDPLFVGLIFSVFSNDSTLKAFQIKMICFQTQGNPADNRRCEIPLVVKSASATLSNLEAGIQLPLILSQEERETHALASNENERMDPLTRLHNDAFRTLALTQIVAKIDLPLCETLEAKLRTLKTRIVALESEKKRLLDELSK